MNTGDIGVGSFIRHNGELCLILEYQHRTPGNLRAFFQAKMRNVKTNKLVEYRFRAGEDVELVRVEQRSLQYLYKEGENLVLMDTETFEQLYVGEVIFGDSLQFLKEGVMVSVSFDDSERPISAEPPKSVELQITYTEPGAKGDTVNKVLKQATLETGATISVPLYCEIGDMVKVNPLTGEFSERVKVK